MQKKIVKWLDIKMDIGTPIFEGETVDDAIDRLVDRIDPDGDTVMGWCEDDVEVSDIEDD